MLLPQLCGAVTAVTHQHNGAAPLAWAESRRVEGDMGRISARTAARAADLVQKLRAQSQAYSIPPLCRGTGALGA